MARKIQTSCLLDGQIRKTKLVDVEQNAKYRTTVGTDGRMSAGGQVVEYLTHFRFVDHVADHDTFSTGLVAEHSLDVRRPVGGRQIVHLDDAVDDLLQIVYAEHLGFGERHTVLWKERKAIRSFPIEFKSFR